MTELLRFIASTNFRLNVTASPSRDRSEHGLSGCGSGRLTPPHYFQLLTS